ncbi:jg21022, partial [Pararge aegeria aegeria]
MMLMMMRISIPLHYDVYFILWIRRLPWRIENIFQNWLEEKVDLPIFENISQVSERVEAPPAPVPVAPPAA